ncbi:MAG: serine/threonine protein kinase [Sandaracinus sp.]|nr:serine/threonine protein kinase [Sandaracinus sp.]
MTSPEVAVPRARYELGRVLGRGSHAVVHEAVDRVSGARVAIKCFPFGSPRADREARALEALAHRFVVPFLGREDGVHQTQLVQSCGLRSLEDERRPGTVASVAWRIAQLSAAIDAIHARGWTHRDVKPANVLVAPDGDLWLADFSTALRDDEPDLFEGTPHYMSPEAARLDSQGPRRARDWYALGVLLFELATGEVPFSDEDPMEILRKQSEAPRPSLKGTRFAALDSRLASWLRVEPRLRAGGGRELIRSLLEALPRCEKTSRVSIVSNDSTRGEVMARLVADEAPSLRVRLSSEAADLVIFDSESPAPESLAACGAVVVVGSIHETAGACTRGADAVGWRSWNALSTRLALRCWGASHEAPGWWGMPVDLPVHVQGIARRAARSTRVIELPSWRNGP